MKFVSNFSDTNYYPIFLSRSKSKISLEVESSRTKSVMRMLGSAPSFNQSRTHLFARLPHDCLKRFGEKFEMFPEYSLSTLWRYSVKRLKHSDSKFRYNHFINMLHLSPEKGWNKIVVTWGVSTPCETNKCSGFRFDSPSDRHVLGKRRIWPHFLRKVENT